MDNEDTLRDAKPSMPDELQNRRADNWQLQLAIADLCSGVEDFGDKARSAAIRIEGKADNRTIGVQLLSDTKVLFDANPKADCMHSADIVRRLLDDPEKSWSEAFKGKPLTQNRLARVLGSYGIISTNVTPPGGRSSRAIDVPTSRKRGKGISNVLLHFPGAFQTVEPSKSLRRRHKYRVSKRRSRVAADALK